MLRPGGPCCWQPACRSKPRLLFAGELASQPASQPTRMHASTQAGRQARWRKGLTASGAPTAHSGRALLPAPPAELAQLTAAPLPRARAITTATHSSGPGAAPPQHLRAIADWRGAAPLACIRAHASLQPISSTREGRAVGGGRSGAGEERRR